MRGLFLFLALCIGRMAAATTVGGTPLLSLGMGDGLRSNSVTSLLTDSRGLLWIGTTQGLNRYDGYEVKARFPESSDRQLDELFSTPVTAIEEDGDGRLWLECESGRYFLYDTRTAHFTHHVADTLRSLGLNPNGDYRVKAGTGSALWLIDNNTISRYDCRSKTVKTWAASIPLPATAASMVAETADGLYICTADGLWHLTTSNGIMQHEPLPERLEQQAGDLRLMADADGTLWLYSKREEIVCRYLVGGRCIRETVNLPQTAGASDNNAIRDMIDDGKGIVWIATDHKGLFAYDKKTGTMTARASDNATCLANDRDGTLWVGHLKTGLSALLPHHSQLTSHHSPQCGDILAMAYDTKGSLWMGTDGNGVYVEHADGSIRKTPLPNITVMTLLSDGEDGMWAGTYNQGLYHIAANGTWKRYSTDNGSYPTEHAWTMACDGQGRIWTSSPNSKTVIIDKAGSQARVVTDDAGNDIHGNALCYDGAGTMYVASVYGLWSCTADADSIKCNVAFGNKKGTQQWMSQMITGIEADRQKQLLVLRHQEGITVYDMRNDTLHFILIDNLKGMARDHDGVYWLCTSTGSVKAIRLKESPSGIDIISRQAATALPQFFFNGDAMVCSPQGEMLMGGTEGYVSINTRQLMAAKVEERDVIITEIAIGDSLINEQTGTVSLSHDAASITVRFFAGSLEGIQRTRYAYRLVGQMADWATTDHNYVSFHALPPGDYTLQLCTYLEDGTMGRPCELNISVAPPFYRTWPMYIVYALAALTLLLLIGMRLRQRHRERNERQQQLMERQKMEQITEMKLQFFTNISHDLRTPLTLIISPLEQMVKKMDAGGTPQNLSAQLHNILKNARLLLDEVSALLDFRRLDAGGETLNMQRGDIIVHLNGILVSFSDYAEERGIRLSFEHDTDSCFLAYDHEKMNKVMNNLFSNAMKFTPSGGSVTLSFRQDASQNAIISLADTGKGIADSDKKHIFDRFYQVAAKDSAQTGSGIGLHIVNEYVKMHHGTVSVADNHPTGSIFTITLPMEAHPTSSKEGEGRTETLRTTNPPLSEKPEETSILVVDDNTDMLSFVSSCMQEDYHVLTAPDGATALSVLKQEQVGLIISDVMMPGIDGFELCRRVKSDINLSHIPVILLTARDTDVSRIEGLQLGADDYLTKPFNIEVLRLRVKKFIEWEQNNHRQFRQKMNIEPSEITITPLDEQFIRKALDIVEKNIADSDFSVETLADHVAMSRSTLYKKLMAITGQGPSEFIRTIRIKRGKALLETSQMQVTEIAYAVGFTTVKSFTMNFKAEYGMTPSEFLAAAKKKQ